MESKSGITENPLSEESLKIIERMGEDAKEYVMFTEIDGKGLCALKPFMFTVGLCIGINEHSFYGRYCYPNDRKLEAIFALGCWDGKGDPRGNWVKYKGKDGERSNTKIQFLENEE